MDDISSEKVRESGHLVHLSSYLIGTMSYIMIGWIENYTVLGFVLYNELYIDIIPNSLLSSYNYVHVWLSCE